MEFSAGGIGPQASPNAFGPSNDHVFAQQSFGAGCVGSHLGIYPHSLNPPSPHNMLEALKIEIEKEQIRREIIISEIVKVRDLMMGRGLASEMGGDEHLPVKKQKFRKAVDNISSGVVFKENHSALNQKMEWSCALCHVVAPNQQALNSHLQGRKHKRKEAALTTEGPCENSGIKPSSVTSTFPSVETMDPSASSLLLMKTGAKISPLTTTNSAQVAGCINVSMKELEVDPGEDVSGPRSDVLRRAVDLSELSSDVVKRSADGKWSCGLCNVTVPNERSRNEHLQGKKHKKLQMEGTMNLNKQEGVKPTVEPTLVGKTGEVCFMEVNLPPFLEPSTETTFHSSRSKALDPHSLQDNLYSYDLKKNQCALSVQNAELSCSPCKTITPNERNMNEQWQGKKHKMKVAALRDEGAENNYIIQVSPVTATQSVQVARNTDPFLEEGVTLTSNSLLLQAVDSPPLQKNQFLGKLKQKQCLSSQNLEWSCALCEIIAPNRRALSEHLRGRKHKLKEAALETEGAGKSSSPMTAAKSVQAVETMDQSMEEKVLRTSESSLLGESGKAGFKGEDMHFFENILTSNGLNENQASFAQKV